MRKDILIIGFVIFSLGTSTIFAVKPYKELPDKKENKLSQEEILRLTRRVEEIRSTDLTELNRKERHELRKELRTIKKELWRDGQYVYIGTGTLILIILLIVLLA